MTTTLIISPHCDDAALSLGGAIENKAFGQTAVLSVFSRSSYSIGNKQRVESVTQLRKQEDIAILKKLGATVFFADFDDWSLETRTGEIDAAETRPKVEKVIRSMIETGKFDQVLFPLGLGAHPDHMLIREIGRNMKSTRNIGFYEDMPYIALWVHKKYISGPITHFDGLDRVVINSSASAKESIVAAYPSQIAPDMGKIIVLYHSMISGEAVYYPVKGN